MKKKEEENGFQVYCSNFTIESAPKGADAILKAQIVIHAKTKNEHTKLGTFAKQIMSGDMVPFIYFKRRVLQRVK